MTRNVRILFLTPDLFGPPGGIARYCGMVCRALTEKGHPVHIVSLHDKRTKQFMIGKQYRFDTYDACEGNRFQFVRRVILIALQQRPHIILCGHPHLAPLSWLLSRLMGSCFIAFMYGIDVWNPLSMARKRALQRADGLIAISRFTAQSAAQTNNLKIDRIRTLHNCVAPELIPTLGVQCNKSENTAAYSLLTVSRILKSEMYKGHDYVIRALPTLLQRFPNLIYDVVGDGDGRAEMESLAYREGVAHAVRFHGVISDTTINRMYADADVFIMPSRREGFGFVFIEAMAHGVPVIGGNEDATPEVIRNGDTGFTINPKSAEEIVEAVSTLLHDPELRQRMGERGKALVNEQFSFQRFQQTLLSHIAEFSDEQPNTKTNQ